MNKEILKAEVERNGNGTYINIKTAQEIEELFKLGTKRNSSRCQNTDGALLRYYARHETTENLIRTTQQKFNIDIGNYGEDIESENGLMNFSILRTVGIKDGIKYRLPEKLYSTEYLEEWVKRMRDYGKYLYVNYCSKVKISTVLTIEE